MFIFSPQISCPKFIRFCGLLKNEPPPPPPPSPPPPPHSLQFKKNALSPRIIKNEKYIQRSLYSNRVFEGSLSYNLAPRDFKGKALGTRLTKLFTSERRTSKISGNSGLRAWQASKKEEEREMRLGREEKGPFPFPFCTFSSFSPPTPPSHRQAGYWETLSLVLRPVRTIRGTRGGLEPSAILGAAILDLPLERLTSSRLRQTADVNLYHVTKFSPYFLFTLYCFFTKISSFTSVLTTGIVRDCF